LAKQQNLTSKGEKKTIVLIAALDWGLGHATRCIPIIYQMLNGDCEVIMACSGAQRALWSREFPEIRLVELPGYGLHYAKKGWSTLLSIIFQIPKILICIKREKAWLAGFLATQPVDFLISDNRYGLYHPSIRSVFITHQLSIASPFGEIIGKLLFGIHRYFISAFDICWVPDLPEEPNLAGKLSHPVRPISTPLRYIGPLSRFRDLKLVRDIDVLIILSGLEPQRSILEKSIRESLQHFNGRAVLVRGLPEENTVPDNSPKLSVYDHLAASELNALICRSEFVICRSGYSSIMDLMRTGSKSIMIPTPGQPEQQYLAAYLSGQSLVYCVNQHEFELIKALNRAKSFQYKKWTEPPEESLLKAAIVELIQPVQAQA
jgi:UDP-N-acetylglucosamine transferase subunit ALG13